MSATRAVPPSASPGRHKYHASAQERWLFQASRNCTVLPAAPLCSTRIRRRARNEFPPAALAEGLYPNETPAIAPDTTQFPGIARAAELCWRIGGSLLQTSWQLIEEEQATGEFASFPFRQPIKTTATYQYEHSEPV